MKKLVWIFASAALCLVGLEGRGAGPFKHSDLDRVNACLQGQVLDFTHNHGADRRIWSPALCSKRDLYVYVPPGFDPQKKKYPLAIFLHGATQDEQMFIDGIAQRLDEAIVEGKVPPFVVAVPDGSLLGRPSSLIKIASFFANTDAGRFEDYVMDDVWNFVMESFPIRPEREAHAILGVSMGGSAAFAHAIKHRDKIKIAIGIMPALNLRWVDCHDRYFSPFDPCCWGWRSGLRPREVVGRPDNVMKIRAFKLYGPLIGNGPDSIAKLSAFNPIELMSQYDLKEGDLDLFAGYGGQDEFNITAQVESFLYCAKERGISVGVAYDPVGRHDEEGGRRLFPYAVRWIQPLMAPFAVQKQEELIQAPQ